MHTRKKNAAVCDGPSHLEMQPADHVLKVHLMRLGFIQDLQPERQITCVSKLLHARDAAFGTPQRRRSTSIIKDLEKAEAKLEKGKYDLSWLPADCWPFLLQERAPSTDYVKKRKKKLLKLLSESLEISREEAKKLGESKGGQNKKYDVVAFAFAVYEIYLEFGGQHISKTYKDDEGWTSELFLFALEAYRILLPPDMETHQWALTAGLKEATETELASKIKKLRTWLNKRDIGPPMRDRKIIS